MYKTGKSIQTESRLVIIGGVGREELGRLIRNTDRHLGVSGHSGRG
jgi:hypothetical protein